MKHQCAVIGVLIVLFGLLGLVAMHSRDDAGPNSSRQIIPSIDAPS
ncbi:hypothetical protein OSJ77_15910 [Phyllobacterium sp. 0TCS1.6C]|nr:MULTISPECIES: hypothetical protein [unclassified Phyllobacterium]MCX8281679.1 hypothetical protein [Phyllobacterium sp. 0TCS1.6C]MCX8294789.1 hypothetical protein [Phyllobacterium sp. 0TCS1.6A]